MEKTKRVLKRVSSILIIFTMLFTVLLGNMMSFAKVEALESHDVVINFTVDNSSNVDLSVDELNRLLGTRGESTNFIDFVDTTNNNHYDTSKVNVVCSDNKHCTATVNVLDEHGVKVTTSQETPFQFVVNENDYHGAPLDNNENVTIVNKDEQSNFEGDAYLVWSCDNKICYHLFHNLSNNATFVKASTIKADNDASKSFDVHASEKFFAPVDLFTSKKALIDANTVDINSLIGPDGIDYMPVGEPTSNNAYTSYGNRNFKITLYGDDYRGVTLGSLNGLKYYPSVWTDELGRIESYDISGTTKNNPVDIETVLLEPTINIKTLSEYNGFNISKIEALDVPNGAVTITKTNDEFHFNFSSNYYDKVVFKVTSTSNETYYLRIKRLTLDVTDSEMVYPPNVSDFDLKTDFYYDRTTSYDDYILTAKIEYKDGTTKLVNMTNAKEIENMFGEKIYTYEVDDQLNPMGPTNGKGLKIASYKYTFKNGEIKKVKKVYINVEYNGSTSTNYAGAFVGSGKGVVVTFREGQR